MSTRADIRITRTNRQFTVLRMDESGATPPTGPFTNFDTAATRLDPVDDIPLWANTDEMFYFGNGTPWAILGFLVGTIVPIHPQGFTVEYFNGSTWEDLPFKNDSTLGLNRNGYIVWVIPSDWDLTTVNGASAYFIRVQSKEVTTAGRAQHFLPLVESKPPIKLEPIPQDEGIRNAPDVNAIIQTRDIPNPGIVSLVVECTTNAFNLVEIRLLQQFMSERDDLRIDDLATTEPIDWTLDSQYKYYEGRLNNSIGRKLAQKKMDGDDYNLEFQISKAVSLFDLLGL